MFTLTYKECRLLLILMKKKIDEIWQLNYFDIDKDFFYEKCAFSFCVEAFCKHTHGQTYMYH